MTRVPLTFLPSFIFHPPHPSPSPLCLCSSCPLRLECLPLLSLSKSKPPFQFPQFCLPRRLCQVPPSLSLPKACSSDFTHASACLVWESLPHESRQTISELGCMPAPLVPSACSSQVNLTTALVEVPLCPFISEETDTHCAWVRTIHGHTVSKGWRLI